MKINELGKSGIKVNALGMGCWAYGGGQYWGNQAQEDVNDVVSVALAHGVNYFDTAEVYNDGESERSLGIALKGRRHEAIIGSKVSTSNVRYDTLIDHCEQSLKRLGTDYIDIYMLHWPINPKAIEHFSADKSLAANPPTVEEAFRALEALKKAGKIREIGISNHGVGQMKEVLATGVSVAVNELPYNLISRSIEDEILPYCSANGISILGYMVFQQGILTGIYDRMEQLSEAQAHSRHFKQERGGAQSRHYEDGAEDEIVCLLDTLKKMSGELNVPVATISLSWAMANGAIASTLAGSRNAQELLMNIKAADYVLPQDAMEQLNKVSLPILKKLGSSPDYYENRKDSRIW